MQCDVLAKGDLVHQQEAVRHEISSCHLERVQFKSSVYFWNFYIVFLAAVDYECETIIYPILFIHHLIVHSVSVCPYPC